jgi:hypothetical protein
MQTCLIMAALIAADADMAVLCWCSGDVDFFCCDSPTVCAGNLADSQYIVQVG